MLAALLFGALSALGFQPVGLWPLVPFGFAALLWLLSAAPRLRRALALGWAFGVGQFLVGLNWIATAFTFQAEMPAWLGWVAVFLLSLYLAVYPALAAGLSWRFGRARPLAAVLALAGGWAIAEWLRATMFTGFAWNPAGVALVDTPWRAIAPFVGTYGLSLLSVLMGGALWLGLARRTSEAMVMAALLALCGLVGGLHAATPYTDTPIRIVQPNIDQADKWRDGFDRVAAEKLYALSTRQGRAGPTLLLWPEAAVVDPVEDERLYGAPAARFERLRAIRSLREGDLLLTGGLGVQSTDGYKVAGATNSVYAIDTKGEIVARYDKAHLVPYGEYLPMRTILEPIGLSRLAPGSLDFTFGPGARSLDLGHFGTVGLQVCYEIIFSGQVVDRSDRPDFIFNPSNDAWFGAFGPPQHLAQARLRAAEEGLPVVRATPTGISAVVDARGRLLDRIGWREAGIIDGVLPGALAPTPFARLGNLLPLLLAAGSLLIAIALGRGRR
nr:apolipoprotein N-acyltransferase [Sphingomicrobium nitratireducens]